MHIFRILSEGYRVENVFRFSQIMNTVFLKTVFSPNGEWIPIVDIWKVLSEQYIKTFRAYKYRVNCIAFSPDGQCLVSGSNDKTIGLWKFFN